MMNFQEFVKAVHNKVAELLPDKTITVEKKIKNNGREVTGICIRGAGESVAPILYLNDVYDSRFHEAGTEHDMAYEISSVASLIADDYKREFAGMAKHLSGYDTLHDFASIKDKICFRLVNRKENKALLENRPYHPYLDLALYFYIDTELLDKEVSGSIAITNDMMKIWGVEASDLFCLAFENTPRISEYRVKHIAEMLMDAGGEMFADELDMDDTSPAMYVATNKNSSFGASVMMDRDVCSSFADKCGKDFYILPSSVHEVLFIPDNENIKVNELADMVKEVNQTQVAKADQLSNGVYLYMKETGHTVQVAF